MTERAKYSHKGKDGVTRYFNYPKGRYPVSRETGLVGTRGTRFHIPTLRKIEAARKATEFARELSQTKLKT